MFEGSVRPRLPRTLDDIVFCVLCDANLGRTGGRSPTLGWEVTPAIHDPDDDSLDIVEWLMSAEDSLGIKVSDDDAAGHWPPKACLLCEQCVDDFASLLHWHRRDATPLTPLRHRLFGDPGTDGDTLRDAHQYHLARTGNSEPAEAHVASTPPNPDLHEQLRGGAGKAQFDP